MPEKFISYTFWLPLNDASEIEVVQRALLHSQQEMAKSRSPGAVSGRRIIKFLLGQLTRRGFPNALFYGENEMPALREYLCERKIASGVAEPFDADLAIITRVRAAMEEELVRTLRRWVAEEARVQGDRSSSKFEGQ